MNKKQNPNFHRNILFMYYPEIPHMVLLLYPTFAEIYELKNSKDLYMHSLPLLGTEKE